jgi:tripartite-type tricarboxylate transporter receptor subunit TctC
MKLPRRRFLPLAVCAATLPAVSRLALAQTYPTRPVRIIVGFPAGGVGDILARLIATWLSELLGQSFIIENRPGAGTNLAAETVIRSPPDGYTLLWISSANAINATLYDKLNFNFIRDIAPVASVVSLPGVMEVNPALPAKSVPEFIAYARANPGKINMASGGIGTMSHVAGELFKMMAGVEMVHVPFRGAAPALTELMAGRVHVIFVPIISSIEHIRTGRLRALAVTPTTRLEILPDVPAIGEFVPGYNVGDWGGFGAPKGSPAVVADKLNREINAALANSKIKARLADMGATVLSGSPVDFSKFIADETEKWAKVVKFAGAKED